jgi:hypothetical protein
VGGGAYHASRAIQYATRSDTMMVGMFVLADGIVGMIDASTT